MQNNKKLTTGLTAIASLLASTMTYAGTSDLASVKYADLSTNSTFTDIVNVDTNNTFTTTLTQRGQRARAITSTIFQEPSAFCTQLSAPANSNNFAVYPFFSSPDYNVNTGSVSALYAAFAFNKAYGLEVYGNNRAGFRFFSDAQGDATRGVTDGDVTCFEVTPANETALGQIAISFDLGQSWTTVANNIAGEIAYGVSAAYQGVDITSHLGPNQSDSLGQSFTVRDGVREGVVEQVYAVLDARVGKIDPTNVVEQNYLVSATGRTADRNAVKSNVAITKNSQFNVSLVDADPSSFILMGFADAAYDAATNTGGRVHTVVRLNSDQTDAFVFNENANRFITNTIASQGVGVGDNAVFRVTVDNPATVIGEGTIEVSLDNGNSYDVVATDIAGEIFVAATLTQGARDGAETGGDTLLINMGPNQQVGANGVLENPAPISAGFDAGITAELSTFPVAQ